MPPQMLKLSKPIRIGFCGVGNIAGAHLTSLPRIEGAELVGIYDVARPAAEAAAARFDGKPVIYDSLEDMLEKGQLDALYICVPPFAHNGQELKAIEAGVPFLVEKPLALDMEYPLKVLNALKAHPVLTAVGHQLRYSPAVEKMQEIVNGKQIGLVQGYYLGGLPGTPWWRVRSKSGGQVIEQTIHTIDMMRAIVGDVDEVYASYALRALQDVENLDIDDTGLAIFHFKNGANGTLATCCIMPQGGFRNNEVEVVCRDFVARIGGGAVMVTEPGVVKEYRLGPGDAMLREDYNFLEAIATGNGSLIRCPYEEALRSHAVAVAMGRSNDEHRPVKISEVYA